MRIKNIDIKFANILGEKNMDRLDIVKVTVLEIQDVFNINKRNILRMD